MEYRREIDGLRALAVLPVIFFHAGFQAFAGGFVGVDIFFVISGYLITSILLREFAQQQFSLVTFYERRARRILPALFVVMLCCIPMALLLYSPAQIKDLGKSLAAVPLFSSNFLFWQQSDYFDTATELKPLLHTWSLAVEEQYYLLFPLILMGLWRYPKVLLGTVLGLVGLASLFASYALTPSEPSLAFYLLPTRAWELLMGAVAAWWLWRVPVVKTHAASGCLAALGLGLIVFAMLKFDKHTPFPSVYALLPVAGAVLIVLFAHSKNAVGRILGNRWLVAVGLISYSAYLWHQPLFAFTRAWGWHAQEIFVLLCALTLVLAYATWRWVEQPFRDKQRIGRQQILKFSVLGSVFFVAVGLLANTKVGSEVMLTSAQKQIMAFADYEFKDAYRLDRCFLNEKKTFKGFDASCAAVNGSKALLVWGDSHAAALSFGLRMRLPDVAQYTSTGCPPLMGLVVTWRPTCKANNDFVAEQLRQHPPRMVLLHANWTSYGSRDDVTTHLKHTLEHIQTVAPQAQVVVVGSVAQYMPGLPQLMMERGIALIDNLRLESQGLDSAQTFDQALKLAAQEMGVSFYSALDAFCHAGQCLASARYDNQLMPMVWDYGHLTTAGSTWLTDQMLQAQIFAPLQQQ